MKEKRMKLLFVIVSSLALGAVVHAQPAKSSKDRPLWTPLEKFDDARDPAKDLKLAIAEAQRSRRRILLDVGGEWCIWCHRLDTLFMKNADVADFLHSNFVVVKVHYDRKINRNEPFLSRFPEIPGYPHLFVLERNGRLLKSQDTSELEEGKGHSKGKVMAFLRAWAPKRR